MCAGNASMGIIASTRLVTKLGFYCDRYMNKTQCFKSSQAISDLYSFLKSEYLKALLNP